MTSKQPIRSEIAQVPSAGYVQKDNHSKVSIQWLECLVEQAKRKGESLRIEHALNGGEARVSYYKADGPAHNRGYGCYKVDGRADKTVYEFHGTLTTNVSFLDD